MDRRLRFALAGMLCGAVLCARPAAADGDLISLMTALQNFTHKLQLSLEHGNFELAGFYLHELEETAEAVEGIAEYDGHPVGQLTEAMLPPVLARVAAALNVTDAAAADRELDALIAACNACHTATEFGFISIQRSSVNPYPQSFEPR